VRGREPELAACASGHKKRFGWERSGGFSKQRWFSPSHRNIVGGKVERPTRTCRFLGGQAAGASTTPLVVSRPLPTDKFALVKTPEENDPLVELERLRFQERSVTNKWERACNRLAHFPTGPNERQVAQLADELAEIRQAIHRLSKR
jgi:hypothetical protein